ncbi:hypothetical protein QJQ45_021132 [Haematococcus lacustris]|nr:hypothetical protein QJQ45_021132 [Haematococcus lacustris]
MSIISPADLNDDVARPLTSASHTVLVLLEHGAKVTLIDNLSNSFMRVFEHMTKLAGDKASSMKFVKVGCTQPPGHRHVTCKAMGSGLASCAELASMQCDLNDYDLLTKLFSEEKFDCVIHFAGFKAVGESVEKPLEYYYNNFQGTITLLRVMREQKCKNVGGQMVFSSSCTVYGMPDKVPITEDTKLNAISPYGRTKLFQEEMFRDLSASDPEWRILLLRYFNPIGAHPSGQLGEHPVGIPNNLMPYIQQVALGQREVLRVWGNDYPTPDGTAIRDYIHVMDLAEGHVAAVVKTLKTPDMRCKPINLGTGTGSSVLEMVAAFEKASGKKVPYQIMDRRPGDSVAVWAATETAETELGWKAKYNINDISDPHGIVFWKGRYHIFYQHAPNTCQWWWGMQWEHLVSEDLVSWARLPPAIMPTPGGLDADGCFTGNIQIHPKTGVPIMFYTGARLRHNPALQHPDPPLEHSHPLSYHWETQLCAMADPDDELLIHWTKVAAPWMELPHCAYLTSWRDPFFVPLPKKEKSQRKSFVFKVPSLADGLADKGTPDLHLAHANGNSHVVSDSEEEDQEEEYMMLIGSGLEGLGGTALIYRSPDLAAGWRFQGYLCSWPNLDTGLCWECPHMLPLFQLPTALTCFSSAQVASLGNPDCPAATDPATRQQRAAKLADMAAEAMRRYEERQQQQEQQAADKLQQQQQQQEGKLHTQSYLDKELAVSPKALPPSAFASPATAALANGYGGGTAAEAWALARAASGMESAHSISDQSVELISQVIVRQPVTDVLAATDPTEHNGREPEQEALHSVLHSVSSLHQSVLDWVATPVLSSASPQLPTLPGPDTPARPPLSSLGPDPNYLPAALPAVVAKKLSRMAPGEAGQAGEASAPAASLRAVLGPGSQCGGESPTPDAASELAIATVLAQASAQRAKTSAAVAAAAATATSALQAALEQVSTGAIARANSQGLAGGVPVAGVAGDMVLGGGLLTRMNSGAHAPAPQQELLVADIMAGRERGAAATLAAAATAAQGEAGEGVGGDATTAAAAAAFAQGTGGTAGMVLPRQITPCRRSEDCATPLAPSTPPKALSLSKRVAAEALLSGGSGANTPRSWAAELRGVGVPALELNQAVQDVAIAMADAAAEANEKTAAEFALSGLGLAGVLTTHSVGPGAGLEVCGEGAGRGRGVSMGGVGGQGSVTRASSLEAVSALPLVKALAVAGDVVAGEVIEAAEREAAACTGGLAAEGEVGAQVLGGEGVKAAMGTVVAAAAAAGLPAPPEFSRGKHDMALIRATCRAYHEAAAAVQGYDLGLPDVNADVVKRCAEGPPPVPTPAAPGQRWFLSFAPDAATYGILYFIGDFENNRQGTGGLGRRARGYDLETSSGPYKLDLGNVLYAPLAFYDAPHQRHLVWGYLKELRTLPPPPSQCNKFVSSGCLSMPRALYLRAGKLHQVPIPELSLLRSGSAWRCPAGFSFSPDQPLAVPAGSEGGVDGQQVDVELVVSQGKHDMALIRATCRAYHEAAAAVQGYDLRLPDVNADVVKAPTSGSSSTRTVLLLDSWRPAGKGAAALVFDWATHRLSVVFDAHQHLEKWRDPASVLTAPKFAGLLGHAHHTLSGGVHTLNDEDGAEFNSYVDPEVPPVPDMNPAVPDWIRMRREEAGGVLDMQPGESLQLRLFIDASAVEIFTGTGQALCTRVYRGVANPNNASSDKLSLGTNLQLMAVGGACEVERFDVHKCNMAWLRGAKDAPLAPPINPEALAQWKAAGKASL